MSDLNTPMFSYKQYVNDKQSLKQTGTVDAGIQKQSPKSAGARGLQKTHEFVNTTVTMMGQNVQPVDQTVDQTKPVNLNQKNTLIK